MREQMLISTGTGVESASRDGESTVCLTYLSSPMEEMLPNLQWALKMFEFRTHLGCPSHW